MNEFQTGFCYKSEGGQNMFFRGNRLCLHKLHTKRWAL